MRAKPVESTSKKTCSVPHQAKWVSFRESRSCFQTAIDQLGELAEDREQLTYAFTDGSSLGGFGCVLVRPQDQESLSRWKKPDASRNVGAELEGFLLALDYAREGENLLIVSDYLGVAAWMTGNWKIKKEEVRWRIEKAKQIIEDKALMVRYCHHGGHQSDDSDFTRYNTLADRLAENGNSMKPERGNSQRTARTA